MKAKSMKKALAAVLTASMLLGLTACGGSKTSEGPELTKAEDIDSAVPSWTKHTDNDTELEWYINASWMTGTWGEDWNSAYMKEKTGFNLKVSAPSGNEAEKLNTMMASGDMPDIITLAWNEPQVAEMIDAGMIIPMNELADNYDPYFYEVAKPDLLSWNTKDDGNFYGYNCFTTTPSDFENGRDIYSNRSFLVRKDMWEALGEPTFDTPENFYNALVAAKEMFPTVNDGMSMIPLGAMEFTTTGSPSFDDFLADWLGIPYEKDGKLYDRKTDSEYIKWMKMFRQANEDGLISKDIYIDKAGEQITEKFGQGRYFCGFLQWVDFKAQQQILTNIDPEGIYIGVEGPRNSNGNAPTLASGSINGWLQTFITTDCENPQRAMEFITYMVSPEGQKDQVCGEEGKMHDMVDGKAVYTDEFMALANDPSSNYVAKTGYNFWSFFEDPGQSIQWLIPMSDSVNAMRGLAKEYATFTAVYEIPEFIPDSEEAVAKLKIDELWGKTQPALLTAATEEEFDKILAEFVQSRNDAGYDMLMEAMNKQMESNKQKLGMNE